MKLHCPHCGVKGSADHSYYGKNVKCPKCKEIFVASGDVAVEAKVAEEPLPAVDDPGKYAEIGGLTEGEAAAQVILPEATHLEEQQHEAGPEERAISAADENRSEEKEELLDWSDIVAEIESQAADDKRRGRRDSEGAPADLASLFAADDQTPGEELDLQAAKPEMDAETVAGGNEHFPDKVQLAAAARTGQGLENAWAFRDKESEAEQVQAEAEPMHVKAEQTQEIKNQPYGLVKEQCWQCGKKENIGVPFIARDGRLYCPDCLVAEAAEADVAERTAEKEQNTVDSLSTGRPQGRLTIAGALREVWEKTKGAKGAIWAGSAVMYITVLILMAGGAYLLPMVSQDYQPETNIALSIGNICFQVLTNLASVLFSAGLLFMGIRKVAGEAISWKMVFTGFSSAQRIIIVTILQSVLILIGFLILVLPGIYLAIGYSMAIPLIVDRKMSPWQALETSRKAIHKVWWKVVGLYLVMGLIFLVSLVPLGIGMIWTWPMFIILAGVVYRGLFAGEK